ncbi:hypothetical protein GJS40_13525 [Aliibacillus thermotolerans]|nr:hypothetical protein [Aliibacillus thermotolerans]
MGEEKPEEELMGKRKPSPRLQQHGLHAAGSHYGQFINFYTSLQKKW